MHIIALMMTLLSLLLCAQAQGGGFTFQVDVPSTITVGVNGMYLGGGLFGDVKHKVTTRNQNLFISISSFLQFLYSAVSAFDSVL
jgi:hypothetical protein